jgi:hypothetical protein
MAKLATANTLTTELTTAEFSPRATVAKVKKPHPDFPLTPNNQTKRWCKKVRGVVHYFGPLDDPPRRP